MEKFLSGVYVICGKVVLVVALALGTAFPFMWLWNFAVVAALSIAQPITYWPAFWLMLFTGLFVKASKSSGK